MLFDEDLLRTRRALLVYKVHVNIALLVFSGTPLRCLNALWFSTDDFKFLTHSERRPQIFIPKRK